MVSSEGLSGSPAPAAKQYGVTKPISVAGPTEADRQRSRELEKVCIDIIVFQESSIFFFFFDIEVLMLKFWFLVRSSWWMLGFTRAKRKLRRERRFSVEFGR